MRGWTWIGQGLGSQSKFLASQQQPLGRRGSLMVTMMSCDLRTIRLYLPCAAVPPGWWVRSRHTWAGTPTLTVGTCFSLHLTGENWPSFSLLHSYVGPCFCVSVSFRRIADTLKALSMSWSSDLLSGFSPNWMLVDYIEHSSCSSSSPGILCLSRGQARAMAVALVEGFGDMIWIPFCSVTIVRF